jgi:hypothetical protein
MKDVTRILSEVEQGDPQAAEQLLPLVYEELRSWRRRSWPRRSRARHSRPRRWSTRRTRRDHEEGTRRSGRRPAALLPVLQRANQHVQELSNRTAGSRSWQATLY